MKRFFALALALILCLGLCACGQEKAASTADGPRSDISVTPIPRPGEAEIGKPDAPAAPAATEKPAPADILVTDRCAISGTLTYDNGYRNNYSFTLPQISGVETDYVLAANREIDGIYDDHVASSLEAMRTDGYPESYCASYAHAETDGVHSLLVTCDSDWGEDYFWCYNFDAWGEPVDNAALLALAGMTPEQFVKTARDFLTEATDLSNYFEDDGWKEYQEQTIAESNCNAEMPMVILPDGNLCFIATVYTPAGAGVYDSAYEILDSGDIGSVSLGAIALEQLWGTYLVEGKDPDDDRSYYLEFITVGDTLSAQVTAFSPESNSVHSYFAADIIPNDPADLLRADGEPFPVRVLSYCPDVFGGSYYGEAGLYTMAIGNNSVTFSDFRGGTPFIAEEFTATFSYDETYMLDYTLPQTDYEHFDYSLVEESGIAGVWTGSYLDADYNAHSLTLELNDYGGLRLRDCVDGEIPRLMGGSYYIAGEGDDFAEEAGMTVFNLVTIGGYKMPYMGACWIYVDEDGSLDVYDAEEGNAMGMLLRPTEYICSMRRVPTVRTVTGSRSFTPLAEGDSYMADIRGDGLLSEYSYSFVRDKNAGDAITAVVFTLDGEESTLDDLWLYGAEIYVADPGCTCAVYFYIDGQTDNDYHYTDIVGADDTDFWYVGSFSGGFDGEPRDPERMAMRRRLSMLSSVTVSRDYRVGLSGLPQPIDAFPYAVSDLTLTAKRDIDAWMADSETGELVYDQVLPAGTKLSFLRTDGKTFWDLLSEGGDCYRVWVDRSDGGQTVGGVNISDCFDGLMFAG